ncbi:MAG: glycosyltransferase, partial [Friedmanniella sp.]
HMAYSFGRPVVATNVGSMADAVAHDITGLLTPPDAGLVADALAGLLTEPARADRLGAGALRRATQEADWADVAARSADAYRGLLPPPPVAVH